MHCARPIPLAESRDRNPIACGTQYAKTQAKRGRMNSDEKFCENPPQAATEKFYKCTLSDAKIFEQSLAAAVSTFPASKPRFKLI